MVVVYTLVILVALVLIVAAFLPKAFELRAETVINAPMQKVFDYVKLFENQKNYSVWVMKDPNSVITYSGTSGTVGAKQARSSTMKDVGAGEQEIIKLDEPRSMDVEVRFQRPMKATNLARNVLEDVGNNQTKITNIFTGVNPRPGNLISMFFLPKVKKDMQDNMNNLKVQVEKV